MGFAQAYYTSCESGLSGFAGFQFNAATPGLSAQVLREVEALTSYEPPRSLGYHPSAAEIAACPVNLVYRSEPTTVLANVVFVGLDSSGRLGNYFAHALIREDPIVGLDRILPIELWGSMVWASDPIGKRELPELPELPDPPARSPVNRARVDRFLAGRNRPEQLTSLLTAAQNAVLGQGRSIVIVEPDNAAAAHWIGAISFLLPPAVARRMSFATYRHRPEYSDAHVIATMPDSDFELGDSAFHSYVVFDATSGRISEVPADPAAALLVRAGASRAAGLWERAAQLGGDAGTTLAQWHPALVMASMLAGSQVSVADLDVLSAWLGPNGARLAPATRRDLLAAFLDHRERAPQHLNALAELARLADLPALTTRIEQAAVDLELERLTEPNPAVSPEIGTGVPVMTAAGRAFAVRRCGERLRTASAPAAVSLLGWSDDLGLVLPEAALRACGERALGPALVHAGGDDLLGVLAGRPALLEGVLAHLVAVVDAEPEAVIQLLAAGLDELIGDDVARPAELREPARLARERSGGAGDVDLGVGRPPTGIRWRRPHLDGGLRRALRRLVPNSTPRKQ